MVIVVKMAKTREVKKTWRIGGLGAKSCDPPLPPSTTLRPCQSTPLQGWPPPPQCTALFPLCWWSASQWGAWWPGSLEREWESIGASDGTQTTRSLPHILSVNSSHRLPFTRSHIH